MSCEYCKNREAYIYDVGRCEIYRVGIYLFFRYVDDDGYEDEWGIEITHCPWCGSKLGNSDE